MHPYLYELVNFRNEGFVPVYLDESFLHHYHGQQFSWFDEGDFLERPSGKGRRVSGGAKMYQIGRVENVRQKLE
jgi:hypothetical protein